MDFDIGRIAGAGFPVVCGTATNVLHNLSRMALGRESITPVLVDRLYDEQTGLFGQLVRSSDRYSRSRRSRIHRHSSHEHPHRVSTWAALSPLALPDLPDSIARRLIEEHLLNPDEFWLPVPPPSVSVSERSFSIRDRWLFLRRYWRGPTWINAAWLLWMGLVRLGYSDEARVMAQRLVRAVMAEGLREYYDPMTGRGMGAPSFAWSALVMELADPDFLAARSYL